jgi:Ras-related protein Rab-1A
MSSIMYDHLFKCVIVGDSAVGKSSFIMRFADDTFCDTHISTIGVDFRFRTIDVDDKRVNLQIWDTAGQERFRTITSAYYRGADGIICVYDVTNLESFEHVEEWVGEIEKYANDNVRIVLVANKCDMENDRVVTEEMGQKLADKYNMSFIETSAKTATNVKDAFKTLARDLVEQKQRLPSCGMTLVPLNPREKKRKMCVIL